MRKQAEQAQGGPGSGSESEVGAENAGPASTTGATAATRGYWLMKAEPDSRIVKGKDVKFSVDDFEAAGTTPWEGVRNYEARNLMRAMRVGDQVLFYHSNCKAPGIAGFAEVAREAYPDHSAWDPEHPYFDPKTDQANPKWFMIDARFGARARHFVPLALLRRIAGGDAAAGYAYIGAAGVAAVKGMALVTRGRLSVQRVEEREWEVVRMLAERGGWEEEGVEGAKGKGKGQAKGRRGRKKDEEEGDDAGEAREPVRRGTRKRKAASGVDVAGDGSGSGRRTRAKKT